MNLETVIAEKVHALPIGKQAKVLEFVEDLAHEEVKSKNKPEKTDEEKRQGRLALIGIGKSGRSDLSERVDEMLAEGANKREGWSLP
ncbi:MAG: hypothetical protein LH472_13605 [Pyrinomonadaceae bacterium]|nr:hypothetical protein [Pyrinomonadaceae bacterium]